jgi:hypothetical protein
MGRRSGWICLPQGCIRDNFDKHKKQDKGVVHEMN